MESAEDHHQQKGTQAPLLSDYMNVFIVSILEHKWLAQACAHLVMAHPTRRGTKSWLACPAKMVTAS